MSGLTHLRVYRFEPFGRFEGGLVAAAERMALLGDTKVLDALFVRCDPAGGGLDAVDLSVGGRDATFSSLLDFRLDPERRRSITERTLAEHPGGVPGSLIEAIAATLPPGAAVLAVLQAGPTAAVLEDAVAQCGGRLVADEAFDGRSLAQAVAQLRAAAVRRET